MTASILNSSAILQILVDELKLLVILTWPDLTWPQLQKLCCSLWIHQKCELVWYDWSCLLLKSFSDYINCIAGMKITFCFATEWSTKHQFLYTVLCWRQVNNDLVVKY